MKVYVLQHEHDLGGSSDVKMIGIYRTEHDAVEPRKWLCKAPGFRDHPDRFSIDAYKLGQDHWTNGFASGPVDSGKTGKHTEAA
jgi:hypothetical protein